MDVNCMKILLEDLFSITTYKIGNSAPLPPHPSPLPHGEGIKTEKLHNVT
jgi:hypothetical protein